MQIVSIVCQIPFFFFFFLENIEKINEFVVCGHCHESREGYPFHPGDTEIDTSISEFGHILCCK